jgi:hypothetical protein
MNIIAGRHHQLQKKIALHASCEIVMPEFPEHSPHRKVFEIQVNLSFYGLYWKCHTKYAVY